MKKINLFSKHPIIIFTIVVYDLLSFIIFIIKGIKENKIMEFINSIWNNIEVLLVVFAIIITLVYVFYHKYSLRKRTSINNLKDLNIRLKLLQATYNSIDTFRGNTAYSEEIRKIMTDEEILGLKEYGYSKDNIDRILNAREFNPINK